MMKKYLLICVAIMLGVMAFTGCKKKDKNSADEKVTQTTVLKYLPGRWQVTHYLDEGYKEPLQDKIVLTFGKEDADSHHSGSFGMSVNDHPIVTGGRWYIESGSDDPGVWILFMDEYGDPVFVDGSTSELFITKISATYMEAMEEMYDDEGFALSKIE